MAMDPDRFQMRDLKRRISKLEDQIGYMKTDLKRVTGRLNATVARMDSRFDEEIEKLQREADLRR